MKDRERAMRRWVTERLSKLPDRRARDAWLEQQEVEVHAQLAWWSLVATVIRELREDAAGPGPERLADIIPQWAAWRGLPEDLQPPRFGESPTEEDREWRMEDRESGLEE